MHNYSSSNLSNLEPPKSTTLSKSPLWSMPLAIIAWVASVLLILFLPLLALMPYAATQGIDASKADKLSAFVLSDPTAVLIQLGMILPAHIITFGLAWIVVTGYGKRPFFQSMGWGHNGVKWFHYLILIIGYYILATFLTSLIEYFVPSKENDFIKIIKSSRDAVYLISVMSTLSAPLVEEIVYRGVLFVPIENLYGKVTAVISTSVLFTLVHIPQYLGSLSTIIMLMILSITIGVLRAYSKSILPCIIFHILFNALTASYLILEPYIDTKTEDIVSILLK